LRRTKPIDTALTAAVPISVNTTRRDRFMAAPALSRLGFGKNIQDRLAVSYRQLTSVSELRLNWKQAPALCFAGMF
jgi:hypothetical protein